MGPLIYIASLVVALLGAAIVLPWDSSIIREPLVRDTSHTESSTPQDRPGYSRRTVFFPSQGVNMEAWLYLPKVNPRAYQLGFTSRLLLLACNNI